MPKEEADREGNNEGLGRRERGCVCVFKRQRKFLWVDSESACTMAADTNTLTDAAKEPTTDTVAHTDTATATATVVDICRYNYRYSYRYSYSPQRFICDCSWRAEVGKESGNRSK